MCRGVLTKACVILDAHLTDEEKLYFFLNVFFFLQFRLIRLLTKALNNVFYRFVSMSYYIFRNTTEICNCDCDLECVRL